MEKSEEEGEGDKHEGWLNEYDVIKGYQLESDEIEKETMRFLRPIWMSMEHILMRL